MGTLGLSANIALTELAVSEWKSANTVGDNAVVRPCGKGANLPMALAQILASSL